MKLFPAYFTIIVVFIGFTTSNDSYSQRKYPKNSKARRDTVIVSDAGTIFRAVIPNGFGKPKIDSTLFATDYGNVMMRASVTENKLSSCMIGFYDFFPDYFTGKTSAQALDSLQQQILGNMQGKLSRQYKLMLTGKKLTHSRNSERPMPDVLLESRTTYFTTVNANKTLYWRFTLILDSPRIYQIAVASVNKSYLESSAVNSFFDSLQILVPDLL